MYYLDKDNLVSYIIEKHKKDSGLGISPIKLQKSLYLLYAMWAGNTRRLNEVIDDDNSIGVCEKDNKLYEDLFEPNFEAWKYGPVDPDVYFKFKYRNDYKGKNKINPIKDVDDGVMTMIKSFIDETLNEIFDISDFTLVDITHEDNSWKETYKKYPEGNGKIDSESIKQEYYELM